ncbi:Multidrug resistance protein MdtA [Xanthomonas hydrangeae]|uniref:efflux RND transporter periplasmic adaptor subunit n=1 Tax=Xanthomonas hydrangeae TaxID=2775159 RepID=UPI001963D2BB|nr:Multidrug resistance protein MdtA [Xanthomonas hydrangeae]CAD7716551.1 Multidrug resistance protein MdtA [Xanthomonas hydrangeae]CAD7731993.1 Multidrug resistance protein MdtA [Xanthomonas hydrangeae]CAD7731996.1 Multidrug resistance protein MdtA [Xanthomonas hydrangeae]CAD7734920.1 Multidrug resistance protein MdtA [Xanthomonas hydrangeae]
MNAHTSPPAKSGRPAQIITMLTLVALVVLAVGAATRWSRGERLTGAIDAQQRRTVAIVSPTAVEGSALSAPGRIEAWAQAPIYSRVSGYLRSWSHDIGEPVTAGETLALIDTPDVDQELLQARAELIRAHSDAAFAASTALRWQALLSSQAVSRQDADQRTADQAAREAEAQALQANVQGLEAMQQYRRLSAPFDGVVIARNTDVGALITTGSTTGAPLFVVADVHKLRIHVNIPQSRVSSLRVGDNVSVNVPEWPGETFQATVRSLAGAIDAQTGAMRIQLEIANDDRRLLPGSFATVRFASRTPEAPRNALPPSALIMGRQGVRIALIDDAGRVTLKKVTILRDHGILVELDGGLPANARVINSPPDGIADGEIVRVAVPTAEKG